MVVEFKRKFERYVKLGDVEKLKQASLKAAQLEDFKSEPLIYDIEIINCLYEALVKGKTTKSIKQLTKILETPKLNIDPLTFVNGYIVLSTCYQLEGKLEEAKEVLYLAYELVKNKTKFPRYYTVIIKERQVIAADDAKKPKHGIQIARSKGAYHLRTINRNARRLQLYNLMESELNCRSGD